MASYLDTDDPEISLTVYEGPDAPVAKEPNSSQLRRLKKASNEAFWLYLARRRESAARQRGERLRKRIMSLLKELNARGFVSHRGKHPMSVRIIKQGDLRATQAEEFLEYLGPLAPDVDAKLAIVLEGTTGTEQVARFRETVREIFGESVASSLYVAHNKTKLEDLVSDDKLSKPQQRYYTDVGSDVEQLKAEPLRKD